MASPPAAADDGASPARFAVLGPLCVKRPDGTAVRIDPPLQRRVLATLILSAGVRRTGAWLAEAVWGEHLPGDPAGSLWTAVHGLRRCLGTSLAPRLASPDHGRGYMFRAAPCEVDAMRFDLLAAQGRTAWYAYDPGRAAGLLSEAAGLWGDPPLADVPDTPFLNDVRGILLRGLADVQDLWMDAVLALGGHREAISHLRRTLKATPSREHAWAQLMLALFRDGRPAEALGAFTEARAALRDELGCEPGPWLTVIRDRIADGAGRTGAGAGPASLPAPAGPRLS